MPFRSGSQGTERGFKSTNFTLDDGSSLVTEYFGYITGVATTDGDVEFKTISGTNVRWLTVSPPSVNFGSTGYATYSNDKDVDLSIKDTDLKAYYVNSNTANSVILSETTKTEAGMRSVPITEEIKPLIIECMRFKDGLLFQTENGNYINTNQVNMELQRVLKKYDIIDKSIIGKVTCHSLRHTYATRCIESGISAKVLQKLLGHTDIRITLNTYCDAFEQFETENLNKVNEYMKMQGLTLNVG